MKRCLLYLMGVYMCVQSQGEAIATREESLLFSPMFDVLIIVGAVISYQGASIALRE